MALILDTNAISNLFTGDPLLSAVLAEEGRHHLPVIVIGEYRYGLARSRHRDRLEQMLELLIHQSIVLSIDVTTAIHYANIREILRQIGRPIPENDLWVAALAAQYGLPVISRDAHFDAVPGVERLSW